MYGRDTKLGKKKIGYIKNNKKLFNVVAIDYGIKKKYFKIFF